jgi:hypothetical protein
VGKLIHRTSGVTENIVTFSAQKDLFNTFKNNHEAQQNHIIMIMTWSTDSYFDLAWLFIEFNIPSNFLLYPMGVIVIPLPVYMLLPMV